MFLGLFLNHSPWHRKNVWWSSLLLFSFFSTFNCIHNPYVSLLFFIEHYYNRMFTLAVAIESIMLHAFFCWTWSMFDGWNWMVKLLVFCVETVAATRGWDFAVQKHINHLLSFVLKAWFELQCLPQILSYDREQVETWLFNEANLSLNVTTIHVNGLLLSELDVWLWINCRSTM